MHDAAVHQRGPVRIKLCGLTRAEDVRLAVDLGADYVGLILAPRSPRRLSVEQAAELRSLVVGRSAAVLLVMDNPREEVLHGVTVLRPDVLQFHGGEDDAFCAGFGLPFLKAIAMGEGTDLARTASDGVLLRPDLRLVTEAIQTSLASRRTVYQNLAWALGYNLAMIPLAVAGQVPPWLASVGMSASSLLVVGNALRLPSMIRSR